MMLAAMLIGTLLALAVALLLSRRIGGAVSRLAERVDRLRAGAVAQLERAAGALARGDLGVEVSVDADELALDSRDEIGQLAGAVNQIIRQMRAMVQSFNAARERLRGVLHETTTLVEAARAGRMDARAQASGMEGVYGEMVGGMNDMLAAIGESMQAVSETLERMAERDLTARVTGEFRGAFRAIQETVNEAIGNLEEALTQVATGGGAGGDRPRARSARARSRWRRGHRSRRAPWRR